MDGHHNPGVGWAPEPMDAREAKLCAEVREHLRTTHHLDTHDFDVWWWQYPEAWAVAFCYVYPHMRPVAMVDIADGSMLHVYVTDGRYAYDALGVHTLPYTVGACAVNSPVHAVGSRIRMDAAAVAAQPAVAAAVRAVMLRACGPYGTLGN